MDTLIKHDMCTTRLYKVWASMKDRCKNQNRLSYKNYGGRGITVCDEWINSFPAFQSWAVKNGYSRGQHLDRKDNNKNYDPENCQWVTQAKNNLNTRRNRLVTAFGETKTAAEWSRDPRCLVTYPLLIQRITCGCPPEEALTKRSKKGRCGDVITGRLRPIKTEPYLPPLKRSVISKGKMVCYYCKGTGTSLKGPDGFPWHKDHVIPKSKGGSDKADNLVLSCQTCNLRKQDGILDNMRDAMRLSPAGGR